MTNTTHIPDHSALKLPITSQAIQIATQFAKQQKLPYKREQVYWNTLAVYAVNDYLQIVGFQTDLTASDSWNVIARSVTNTADLEVIGVGRLECRPILPNEQSCQLPPEVWSDRIGYVIAQLNPDERTVAILGFTPEPSETIHLAELRSPLDLIDHLHQLMTPAEPVLVRLDRWIQGIVDAGWETIDTLLASPQLAFRGHPEVGGIERAKRINFGMRLAEAEVVLLVELVPQLLERSNSTETPRTRIRLQVHPTQQPYLPPNLRLFVLDGTGVTFLETHARDLDNVIQLQFFGNPGERFSVTVALADASVTEQFVL